MRSSGLAVAKAIFKASATLSAARAFTPLLANSSRSAAGLTDLGLREAARITAPVIFTASATMPFTSLSAEKPSIRINLSYLK